MTDTVGSPLLWIGFTAFVLLMLALDLGVFHRDAHEVKPREAVLWTCIWIALALVFDAGIYHWYGPKKGLEFLTGYLIEKALSIDNIFVFLVIFSYFGVQPRMQHRVLFWGILGALVMRAAFIFAGAAMLERFHWTIFVFGIFLIFTGIKVLSHSETDVHPERNIILRLMRRIMPVADSDQSGRFIVKQGDRMMITPLLLVLAVVETTDLVFAVDSIPAIFAVSRDPFIVYTSNIFAILGLRALFFLLSGVMRQFVYLHVGLGLVLAFVGVKMMINEWIHVPIVLSLGVIVILLGGSVLVSWLRPPKKE